MPKGHKNGSGWVFCQDAETKDKMDEETLIAGDNQLTSNSQGCPQIVSYNNSYLSSLSFLQLFDNSIQVDLWHKVIKPSVLRVTIAP